MYHQKLLVSFVVVGAMGAMLLANAGKEKSSGAEMVESTQNFLETLNDSEQERLRFDYDDSERLNWHFIPRQRKGLPLRDLDGGKLKSAHQMIQSGLSEVGYGQALDVMSLEEVLYLLEDGDRENRRESRDPEKYYLSLFGQPSTTGTWGWRLEGHHLSLNFSVEDGEVVASTPEFFGANPAYIDAGPGRSIRVLGPEEDLARQILKLCNAEQEEQAWINQKAPDDIRSGGEPQPETTPPVGLPVSKMSPDQKKMMAKLLDEYLQNMPSDVENERRKEINAAGIENIYFAWWGSDKRNERHHYRVQGPTFLVEYNNTQNSANHVHSIWRDTSGDFNVPLEE